MSTEATQPATTDGHRDGATQRTVRAGARSARPSGAGAAAGRVASVLMARQAIARAPEPLVPTRLFI